MIASLLFLACLAPKSMKKLPALPQEALKLISTFNWRLSKTCATLHGELRDKRISDAFRAMNIYWDGLLPASTKPTVDHFLVHSDEHLQIYLHMMKSTAHLRLSHLNLKLFLFKSVATKQREDMSQLSEDETLFMHKLWKESKLPVKVQKWKNVDVQICPINSRIMLRNGGSKNTISLEDVKYFELHPKKVLEVRYSY